jgi:hypothetical protein
MASLECNENLSDASDHNFEGVRSVFERVGATIEMIAPRVWGMTGVIYRGAALSSLSRASENP